MATKKELLEKAKKLGLEVPKGANKADLEALLDSVELSEDLESEELVEEELDAPEPEVEEVEVEVELEEVPDLLGKEIAGKEIVDVKGLHDHSGKLLFVRVRDVHGASFTLSVVKTVAYGEHKSLSDVERYID